MKPLARIILAVFSIILFFVLFCIVWLEHTSVQALALGLVVFAGVINFGFRRMWKIILNLSPFILLLAFVYLLLSIFSFGHPSGYWIHYGLTRSFVLASSLIFMQLVISRLRLDDFLDFPLSIHKQKYIVLGIYLYEIAITAYHELSELSTYIASNQLGDRRLKTLFRIRLAIVLGLITYIINEATLKGEMLDERIRLCHGIIPAGSSATHRRKGE